MGGESPIHPTPLTRPPLFVDVVIITRRHRVARPGIGGVPRASTVRKNRREKVTQVLQVHPDLMHAPRMRETQNHAYVGLFVVADQLECRRTALALAGHLAHADFVADHLDGLIALDRLPVHQHTHVCFVLRRHKLFKEYARHVS